VKASSAPVAQWIERSPPEREVGGSNPPGRMVGSAWKWADLLGRLGGRIWRVGGQWPKRWPEPLLLRPVEGAASVSEKRVEGDAVLPLATVQELGVYVEGHPAFGVAVCRAAKSTRIRRGSGRRTGFRASWKSTVRREASQATCMRMPPRSKPHYGLYAATSADLSGASTVPARLQELEQGAGGNLGQGARSLHSLPTAWTVRAGLAHQAGPRVSLRLGDDRGSRRTSSEEDPRTRPACTFLRLRWSHGYGAAESAQSVDCLFSWCVTLKRRCLGIGGSPTDWLGGHGRSRTTPHDAATRQFAIRSDRLTTGCQCLHSQLVSHAGFS
jgi:hypothetical protein